MEDYELQKAVQAIWKDLEAKRTESLATAKIHAERGDMNEEYGYQRKADGLRVAQEVLKDYLGAFLP